MKLDIQLLPALAAGLLCSCSAPFWAPSASDGPTVTRVTKAGSYSLEVDAGDEARDVVFIFSASVDGGLSPQTEVARLSVDGVSLPIPGAMKTPAEFGPNATAAQRIADFNRTAASRLGVRAARSAYPAAAAVPAPPRLATIGETESFYEDVDVPAPMGAATCHAVVNGVGVEADATPRNLAVWVSDAEWSANDGPITQEMTDALAAAFLQPGLDNDIYDWLTAILGPEWGDVQMYTNQIPFTGDIDIFLTDIQGDNSPNGGIVGFFWAGNNFSGVDGSNERIMFVIDSVMYANDDAFDGTAGDGWDPTDYWPKEIFSTLAHEFQHMIHFYQKAIVAGALDTADVWIDEMCAQLAEDLLADKMGVPGPRGVTSTDATAGPLNNTEGRFPSYNQYSYLPLNILSNFDLYDYSTAYSFGSWAARNYGGAEFLRRVVRSRYTDREAVEQAAKKGGADPFDLDSLMAGWAVAVMGSDRTDMPAGYRYNRGDWFTSSVDGKSFRLGSIDLFRYVNGSGGTGPRLIQPSGSIPNLGASSNVYYSAAQSLTGTRNFELTVPAGVQVHVMLK